MTFDPHWSKYSPGHPWYWRQGGPALSLSELQDLSQCAEGMCPSLSEAMAVHPRPSAKRDQLLDAMRHDARAEQAHNLRRYREQVARVRYRRRWLGPWPDQDRDMWEEPCGGAALKVNHIRYVYKLLRDLDAADARRLDESDFTRHRHPVLAVACPDCQAQVGAWCKRPSGHQASDFHLSRKRASDDAFIAAFGADAWIERLPGDEWHVHREGRADHRKADRQEPVPHPAHSPEQLALF